MRDLVVYGLGELGQLYGAAALRAGLRVTPITRSVDPGAVLAPLPSDTPVLVAVGEDALEGALEVLGRERGQHAILLQNELFPAQWQRRGLDPTVLVVWLLKKKGALTVARPSPVFGRHAGLVSELHRALDIPTDALSEPGDLTRAIIEKYAFIVAVNALGALRDRTVGGWLQEDPLRVRALAEEGARLGAQITGATIDLPRVVGVVEAAMRALSAMGARGRTASVRVARALERAHALGLQLPELTRAAQA